MIDLLRYHTLSEKDRNSKKLDFFQEYITGQANDATVSIDFTRVPDDLMLFVDTWHVRCTSVAPAQYKARFWVYTKNNAAERNIESHCYDVGRTDMEYQCNSHHILMPGEKPMIWVSYDAADPANIIYGTLRGFYFPKGQLSTLWSS